MVVGDDSGTPSQRSLRLRHLCDQLARALRCANRAKCSATIFFAVFTGSPTRRRLPSICRSLEEPNNILGARKNGGIRPSFPGVISQKARRGHLSGNRCQLRRSTQHLRGVYSQESGILGFFLDVEMGDRSVPRGKYCRNSKFVFSFVPRCQGLCGSQK